MAGVVLAVATVWLIVSSSERRLDRMDAAEQQKILAAFDRMRAAAEKLDAEELFGHVVDNDQGALASNGQLLLTRADALERTRANFRGLAALKYRIADRRVTLLAPDAAVLVVTGESEAQRADGRAFTVPFVHSIVMIERDGAWRVVHSHQSSPAPR
ncbi:MAG: nuclear transport factor 2 family protein [Verrucomicrobia bacterium]|nr:nuclear transport factor 2 family protein [Verrucomicrobiota bacterium]